MPKRRISIVKENRIVQLLQYGYDRHSVARICNCGYQSITAVLRRVRRRPQSTDSIRLGRGHSWLSDNQVEDIRRRRENGEALHSIAKDYEMEPSTICSIANYRTYQQSEDHYPFDFPSLELAARRRRL